MSSETLSSSTIASARRTRWRPRSDWPLRSAAAPWFRNRIAPSYSISTSCSGDAVKTPASVYARWATVPFTEVVLGRTRAKLTQLRDLRREPRALALCLAQRGLHRSELCAQLLLLE